MPKFTPGEFALIDGAYGRSPESLDLVRKYEGTVVEVKAFKGFIDGFAGEDWYEVLGDDLFWARERCLAKLPGEFTACNNEAMSKIFRPKRIQYAETRPQTG